MKKTIVIISLAALVLTGCKPTEKNYKAAYEAALSKRQTTNTDADIPQVGMLTNDNAPKPTEVNGQTVYTFTEPLMADERAHLSAFNVAVGRYKMHTNARAHASSLRESGYPAYAIRNNKEIWYTIVSGADSLQQAAEIVNEFKNRNKDMVYPGLPDGPVIEIPSNRR